MSGAFFITASNQTYVCALPSVMSVVLLRLLSIVITEESAKDVHCVISEMNASHHKLNKSAVSLHHDKIRHK